MVKRKKMKKILIFLLFCSVAFAENPYRVFNNFNAGELSPLLNARDDLAKYQSGCQIMENMIPLPQGGATKRPGTKYIAEVKTSSLATRILPFEFSTSQSYILELGNQYMRFFADGAAVNTGDGTGKVSATHLTAHWCLDDEEGATVLDTTTSHNGTLKAADDTATNTSTVTDTGKVDTGSFDLDAAYTVEVADAATLSFTDDSDDTTFSLACWAYITQADLQVLISKWRDSNATREWRLSLTKERKLQLHLADTSADLSGERVAQWYLNDDAADTHVDDVSTNHDGVSEVSNTEDITATGKINACFDFGGAESVEVADNAALSFIEGTNGDFSIATWVAVNTTTGNYQWILSKADHEAGSFDREWELYLDTNNRLVMRLWDESEDILIRVVTDDALVTGWRFVVATYEGQHASWAKETAANYMTLYVDGAAVNSTKTNNASYVKMEAGGSKLCMGASHRSVSGNQNFWADKMDNIVLFNVTLTAANVSALYNSGVGTETMGAAEPFAISDDAISLGWHFLVSTYSAPADETTAADGIILYVDGAVVDFTATNDADYTAMQNAAEEVRIGSQRNSGDTASEKIWADKMDEVAIFSDVLTASEIATLYNEVPYEVETPYLTADLFEIKYEQSADVLYLAHPDYETRKVSRLAETLWTVTAIDIDDGPFRTQNSDVADFIAASATTGSVTLTATGCTPFEIGTTVGHEPTGAEATDKSQTGALFKLVHPLDTLEYSETLADNYTHSQVENTSWMDCGTLYEGAGWTLTTLGTWTGTLEIERNYTIGAAHGADGWESVFAFASTDDRNVSTSGTAAAPSAGTSETKGTEADGSADYRAILTASGDAAESCKVYFATDQTEVVGIVEITSVVSSTSALGTVVQTLGSTDATHKWSEGSWSNYRGWPRTVTFFEDRLCFGGNTSQPDTIWASVTRDYDNMTEGADDDDALLFTLSSRQVNVIEWIIGKDKLLIGTSGAEWTMEGGTDEPLTPSNILVKQHSTYGSANLQATLANESVLFFQRGEEKMRELAYSWELDSYVAPDMTILANLVTDGGITETAFQKTPDSILWCVRGDGEMPIFSYERKENITAWSRMITEDGASDSDFESIARISGDPEDEIWVIVERYINSGTVRYIEQFQPRDFGSDAEDALYVDCSVTYDSASASSAMTGLTHLVGETVSVLADGVVFDDAVVSGTGTITLKSGGTTTTANTVQMGLPYEVHLQTMPLSWVGGVTIQGRMKRIGEVVANWYKSGDFYLGKDVINKGLYSIDGQTTSQDRKTFPPGYDRDVAVYIYQKSPEPLTLLGIATEFEVLQ